MAMIPADLAKAYIATDEGPNKFDGFLTAIVDMTTKCAAFNTPDARTNVIFVLIDAFKSSRKITAS